MRGYMPCDVFGFPPFGRHFGHGPWDKGPFGPRPFNFEDFAFGPCRGFGRGGHHERSPDRGNQRHGRRGCCDSSPERSGPSGESDTSPERRGRHGPHKRGCHGCGPDDSSPERRGPHGPQKRGPHGRHGHGPHGHGPPGFGPHGHGPHGHGPHGHGPHGHGPHGHGPHGHGPHGHGPHGHGPHGHGPHGHGPRGHGPCELFKPHKHGRRHGPKCCRKGPYDRPGKSCKMTPCCSGKSDESGNDTCEERRERNSKENGPKEQGTEAILVQKVVVEKAPRCYSV